MPFTIIRQDITKMKVDAIVNAPQYEPADGRERLRCHIQDGGRIAFLLISSGIYGYPKKKSLEIVTSAIKGGTAEAAYGESGG